MANDIIRVGGGPQLPVLAPLPGELRTQPQPVGDDFARMVAAEIQAKQSVVKSLDLATSVGVRPLDQGLTLPSTVAASGFAPLPPLSPPASPAVAEAPDSPPATLTPLDESVPAPATAPTFVAPTPPAPAALAAPAIHATSPHTYTVQAGDTLSKIARKIGGHTHWGELYAANRQTIGANPNMIHPGQVLTLPSAAVPIARGGAAATGVQAASRPVEGAVIAESPELPPVAQFAPPPLSIPAEVAIEPATTPAMGAAFTTADGGGAADFGPPAPPESRAPETLAPLSAIADAADPGASGNAAPEEDNPWAMGFN